MAFPSREKRSTKFISKVTDREASWLGPLDRRVEAQWDCPTGGQSLVDRAVLEVPLGSVATQQV